MPLPASQIIEAIETAPYNCGVSGAAWMASLGNISFDFDDGSVILFDWEGGKEYQVHFLMKSRGRKAIGQVREAFRTMFTQHGAELIFGLVPDRRRDVKLMARWVGGKSAGRRMTPNGLCELFVLSNIMYFKDQI